MRSFGIDNNQGVHPRITYKQLRKSIQITPLPMAMMSVARRAEDAVRELLSEKEIQPMSNISHRTSGIGHPYASVVRSSPARFLPRSRHFR